MDDEAPVVRYDAAAGTLEVRLSGGEDLRVAGLGADVPFWRLDAGAPPVGALWLSAGQADVLSKMVAYILERVKISDASRHTLAELAPQLAQLKEELDDLATPPVAPAWPPGTDPSGGWRSAAGAVMPTELPDE